MVVKPLIKIMRKEISVIKITYNQITKEVFLIIGEIQIRITKGGIMSIIQMIITRKQRGKIIKMIRISVKIKKPTTISNQIRKEIPNSMKEIINLMLRLRCKAQSQNKNKILSNLRPNTKMNLTLKNKFRTIQASKSHLITQINLTTTKNKRANAKRRTQSHYAIIQNTQ